MRKYVIALLLLSACGTEGGIGNNASAPEAAAGKAVEQAVETAGLTGLYEGGLAGRPNQMCIIDRGTGNAVFGLVVWGSNMHSCSGAGEAVREGDRLLLSMAGDEECKIEATMTGGRIVLPAQVPEGCSYYCGARAQIGGATFERKGTTVEDAMRAVDLVGEPLCAGLSPAG